MKLKIKRCERINGTIHISGSKNSTLPIIAASLLSSKVVVIKNIPLITDVMLMIEIIKSMGVKVKREKNKLKIRAKHFNPIINSKDVEKLRGSYYLIGACLARYNMCKIKLPGGCNFVSRPIDFHIKGFEQMGYKVNKYKDILYITKCNEGSNKINIEKKSVGATNNLILAAALVNKLIEINNASLEPEVLETIKFLKVLGIDLNVKDNTIYVRGILRIKKVRFNIIPDRIETGSYMLLASTIPNSNLIIKNAPIQYLDSVINVVKQIGSMVEIKKDILIIKSNTVKYINLEINEYPSFPTDLQQILSCVLLQSNKESIIVDNIYPKRNSQISELNKMNGCIKYKDNKIIINKSKLRGAKVTAKDLRCAFALIVAGSIASGETIIENAEILLRGYEKPLIKLKKIGVQINEYLS